jgi:hypothetical protein
MNKRMLQTKNPRSSAFKPEISSKARRAALLARLSAQSRILGGAQSLAFCRTKVLICRHQMAFGGGPFFLTSI